MPEFRPWAKIARLNRDCIITEKIDGTNAAVGVTEDGEVYAQNRTKIITPAGDNHGFAAWVEAHADVLRETLGVGLHFGEWWGKSINRGYKQSAKRFSLFNVKRFGPALRRPADGVYGITFEDDTVLDIVPILYEGPFLTDMVEAELRDLVIDGSVAAPGYSYPEGLVVYHTAARVAFKVTIENDQYHKGEEAKYHKGEAN